MPIGIYTRKPNVKYGMTGKHHSEKTKEKFRKINLKKCRDSEYVKSLLNRLQKNPQIGRHHWQWKGGKMKDKDGYILILRKNHPFANKFGYVREHRLVVERKLGRCLKPTESVHHINGIKDDNRSKNLYLFSSEWRHQKFGLSFIEILQKRIKELENKLRN